MSSTETLLCVNGQHEWSRPIQRGRKPVHCPEHPEPVPGVVVAEQPEPQKKAERQATPRMWQELTNSAYYKSCKCSLRKGMTKGDLRKLGSGCTHPYYVCPALDKYRRLIIGH